MTVGDRIKRLRVAKDMAQNELAEKVGITKQSLYKYEKNIITNIPSDKIELIANVLDTTPTYLMGWEDESNTKLITNDLKLSSFEEKLIEAYRDADELTKKMVHRNLGLDEEFEKENLRKNFA